MNFTIVAAGAYESILLGVGRFNRLGDLATVVVCFIAGIYGYICQSGKISRYKEKKQYMTKRINAVIAGRERIQTGNKYFYPVYQYCYTFTGLDEYEGVTFFDKSLLLENIHVQGENVSLLINEHNLEEFWFEEEEEPGKRDLILSIVVIFCGLVALVLTIRDWDRLPWF